LSAKEVAEKSGVTEGVISKFRNSKKTVQTDTLDKLLNALDKEAKIYFFSLLVEEELDIKMIVSQMDAATLSELLLVIADKIHPKKNSKSNEIADKKKVATIKSK